MGRARQLKAQRRWQRLFDEALGLEARTAKTPCETCAMKDPEAWVADIGMARKLLDALQGRARFYCHEGLPVVGTSYLPPLGDDGQVDTQQLTPCGGFLRWALQHRRRSTHEQTRIVTLLQRRMLTRWLASDDPLAQEWRANGWSAADVQMGVQLTDAQRDGEAH